MIYIVYLIGLSFFIENRKERNFCILYALMLIFSKPLRLYLQIDGEEFFLYYSYYLFPVLLGCFYFLKDWTRILFSLSVILIILYNSIIYKLFGYLSFEYYSEINQFAIVFQTGLLSNKVVGWKKTLGLCVVSVVLTYFLAPYI